MVFQNYELFPHLNVIDNILLAPTKIQKRDKKEVLIQAEELLKKVGLKIENFHILENYLVDKSKELQL